jgi:type IV pilus assembly protein PilW
VKHKFRNRLNGLSLIELLIAMGLGAFMLLGIISLVASVSNTRTQLAANSDQIENGRYALELLGDDIALGGFYGKYHANVAKYEQPSPCLDASDLTVLGFKSASTPELPAAVQGYAEGDALPACLPDDTIANSEVLVVRHVDTREIAPSTLSATNKAPYFQVSNCDTDLAVFAFSNNKADLTLRDSDCSGVASAWAYISRAYFLSSCDDCDSADGIPTLKMVEFSGGTLTTQSLVNGVEDIHYRYGLDLDVDGSPDCYVDNPAQAAAPVACAVGTWAPATNWENVVTVEINILVRGITQTKSAASAMNYDLNRTDVDGKAIKRTFNDKVRRSVFSTVVVMPNIVGSRN